MFTPRRCPYPTCSQHLRPRARFCLRFGSYRARCRPRPVPRFRCRSCRRTFSRQSFRMDFGDHKPHLNAPLFSLLSSGLGLRQCARSLGLSRRCCELKFRKLARHLRRLNLNLRGELRGRARLQFDELETYEGRRNSRPLTLAVLIERDSRFVIGSESAPIRPSGRMSEARLRAISQDQTRFGRRPDQSRRAIRNVLRQGARMSRRAQQVVLDTDEKLSYPALAREAFGERRLEHRRTSSKLARRTWNPLFAINHTEAMARDLLGRMRRKSWLASKRGWCLDLGMQLWAAYRNYVRRRFNFDQRSPAQVLGFVHRRLRAGELLGWRQDWGTRSLRPWER